MRIKFKK